jgi:hypothetical protein
MKYQSFVRSTNLIKARLNKIVAYLETLSDDSPLETLEHQKILVYQAEVKLKQIEFNENMKKLLDSNDDFDEQNVIDRQDDINELCVTIQSKIKVYLLNVNDEIQSVASSVGSNDITQEHPHTSVVRLPKIELKHFSGDPHTWIAFINLFDATINSNSSLSPVAKFQYLLGTLSGEALNLIKSLPISEANYTIAYNTLRERYHSVRRLSSVHLNKIIDLPNVSLFPVKNLRHFLNTFQENTQALKALDCDIVDNNPLLASMLLRKFDTKLLHKFENSKGNTHTLPTVAEIIKFLSDYCSHAEDAFLHSSNNKSNYSQWTPKPFNEKSQSRPISLVTTPDSSEFTCFVCSKGGHKVYSCPLFKSKSP